MSVQPVPGVRLAARAQGASAVGGQADPSSRGVPVAPGSSAAVPLPGLSAGHLQGMHVAGIPPRSRQRGRRRGWIQGWSAAQRGPW